MVISRRLVRLTLDTWHGQCVIGGPHCLHVASCADHRWNRGMGGNPRANAPVNLVAACGLCNGEKESNPALRADCVARGIAVETEYPPPEFERLVKTRITDWMLLKLAETPVTDSWGVTWTITPNGQRKRLEVAL